MAEHALAEQTQALQTPEEVSLFLDTQLKPCLLSLGFSEVVWFGIRLACEEALVNAIKHGNQLDREKMVTVTWMLDAQSFRIRVEDQGYGFSPEDVPDPTTAENLERPCGRGLLIMRTYMDVRFAGKANIVEMRWPKQDVAVLR